MKVVRGFLHHIVVEVCFPTRSHIFILKSVISITMFQPIKIKTSLVPTILASVL